MRTLARICVLLASVALVGCGSSPDGGSDRGRSGQPTRLIDADMVVGKYNARAQRITSLWARTSVVIEGEDAEGRDLRERAEGHLQIIPPDRVAITLGKLGDTNLYFGSNDLLYWWFDMVDSDAKSARFGRHESVSAEKIDRLGLPIHPLDLVETLGITPLPTDMGRVVARPGVEDGTIIIAAPTRRGVRRVTVDDERYEPSRIELIGPGGRTLMDVDLSRYRLLAGLETGETPLRVPERIKVMMAGFKGEIRFSLHEPTRREIRAVAFDPAKLLDAYGIRDVYDLDASPEPVGP